MTRSLRRTSATTALALALLAPPALLAPSTALAQETAGPRADNRARAQQLFDSALSDAEAGNFAAACPKFQASHDADPKPSTLLNLASCYEKNGQTASAWGAYREAEGLARKSGRADWEAAAKSRGDLLEPKLVRLTVQVPDASRVAGLSLTRDGARVAPGEWGVPIPVDPGEHVLAATAAGRTPWESRITVKESQALTVPVLALLPVTDTPPSPIAAGPAPAPAPAASWWSPLRTAGVIAGGVGVVGLVTGTALGLVAKGQYDDAKAQCTRGTGGCPPGAVSDSDSAFGLAAGATAVFVVGAVAAAGGVALVLLAPSPRHGEPSPPPSPTASLRLGPGSAALAGTW